MGGYRFLDSHTRLEFATWPQYQVAGAREQWKDGFRPRGCPFVLADEPGAWRAAAVYFTMPSKRPRANRARHFGPSTLEPWRRRLRDGGMTSGTHGSHLRPSAPGRPGKTWDKMATIRKANPLTAISADFRAKLLQERDAARRDTRLKARFLQLPVEPAHVRRARSF